jgi:hypothetical protein
VLPEVCEDRTVLARDGYTFLHVVFAAEIILSAVGDELVIAQLTEVLPIYELIAVGPAIYLLALTIFGYRLTAMLSKRKLFAGRCPACPASSSNGAPMPSEIGAARPAQLGGRQNHPRAARGPLLGVNLRGSSDA